MYSKYLYYDIINCQQCIGFFSDHPVYLLIVFRVLQQVHMQEIFYFKILERLLLRPILLKSVARRLRLVVERFLCQSAIIQRQTG